MIYQMFPRVFSNMTANPVWNGTIEENGSGKLNDITPKVLKSLGDLGVNCIWLTGVIEMATKTSFAGIAADNPNVVKGEAGSPYAIKDYYDIAPCLAENVEKRMEEFEGAVKRIHSQGMKVLIDFVPNHTAREYHSDVAPAGIKDFGADDDDSKFFSRDNNYYYIPNQKFVPHFPLDREGGEAYCEFPAKCTGNDCFSPFCGDHDWYETVKLNYGYDPGDHSRHFDPVPNTWFKMLHILRYWASKGVDGFRCDMVFMVPQEFWHWVIPQVKKDYPGVIFIGEIYDINLYRPFIDYCHFDYLYDKVNLYDTLVGIERHNYSAAQLTGCWQRIDGLGESMLNFLENHDEVRFASREYANDALRVVPSLVVSSMISKGPFMIYYGQELGEPAHDNEGFAGDNNRTTIFDYWSMDRMRRWYDGGKCSVRRLTKDERWLRSLYGKVLTLCNSSSALREGNFFDLMYVNLHNVGFDPHRQYAFLRYSDEEGLLIVANFDEKEREVTVNIPHLAIEMGSLPVGMVEAVDQLWGETQEVEIAGDSGARVRVKGLSAVVLKLR